MTAKKTKPDAKNKALRRHATLNPRPEAVTDPIFASADFFDRRDIIQVKYEMVRRVQVDGQSVTQSAADFGFSRPSFYQAQEAIEREGLVGLLPKKRGPQRSHKLSEDVVTFLLQARTEDPSLTSADLVQQIQSRFNIFVHPRSVERALARCEKKHT